MYAGHFAAGLAIKARAPEAPTWGLLTAVGLLDILFGPFVLAGIERASLTPGIPPGFSLDFIDWSHSLVMSLVWAAGFGALFLGRGRRIAGIMGFAVFSHYLMDLPMHPPDMALWPGSATHLGLGLWRMLPTGWWFAELAVIAVLLTIYIRRARNDPSFGRHRWAVVFVVLLLHAINSPWLSAV